MDHADHVALIHDGVAPGTWAELGSGNGAFTLALADLLGARGRIISVDRDAGALQQQATALNHRFPDVQLRQVVADFTGELELPELDGLLMANSLHFIRDKVELLPRLVAHLRPGGRFVLVEYGTDRGNPWVPHPISFETWRRLAAGAGLGETRRLAAVPSRFLGSIYSAQSVR